MKANARWILAAPVVLLAGASWLYQQSENEARAHFSRAREQWRLGNYRQAIDRFDLLVEKFPDSRFADEALWEIGTIYYVNLHDVTQALFAFERLVAAFPESPLSVEGTLRIAEIFEVELGEIGPALEHWQAALTASKSPRQRLEIRLKIADAHFKQGDFETAFDAFTVISLEGEDRQADQARLRLGNILQIQRDFEGSLQEFQTVLENNQSSELRLQAQLGMIESYERLDHLDRAIEIAESIDSPAYPRELKEDLMNRLLEKRRYYEPRLWTGH
ncbi:MAG TPA: tetratricopeptide repeat protein [Acidobacteriota bacterium]|nr:tetratricopeptide repeat protein [Acidobacteriota bacterium]